MQGSPGDGAVRSIWRVVPGHSEWVLERELPAPKPRPSWAREAVRRPGAKVRRWTHGTGIASVVPDCPRCGNSLAWRGQWRCDECVSHITASERAEAMGLEPYALAVQAREPVCIPPEVVRECPAFGDDERELRALRSARAARAVFSSEEGNNCASISSAKENWNEWLDGVELYTSPWRRARAARHRVGAAWSHWHRTREKGQGERFDRIRSCGTPWAEFTGVSASGKRVERVLETRCDCWRVCQRCLHRRQHRLVEGIMVQREKALKMRECRKHYRGAGGRWSERMWTLTVPHSESAAQDARALTRAWRRFSALLTQHLRLDLGVERSPVWVRALEVAPGATGGHAHLHVWWVGPFVDHVVARALWGKALEEQGLRVPKKAWAEAMAGAVDARASKWCRTRRGKHGKETENVAWPVVHVKRFTQAEVAGKYAAKVGVVLYVAKGAKGLQERLHPAHAASLYEALESARAVQWARGWAPQKKREWESWGIVRLSDEKKRAIASNAIAN